jgi:hypothetical protein
VLDRERTVPLEHEGVAVDVVDPSELVHVGVGEPLRRIGVDAVGPCSPVVGHVAGDLPDAAVALEPGPERDHEHPVPDLEPALGLHVRQHVPQAARRRVTPPVQRHPRRLHVLVLQAQALLHRLDDGRAAGVEAEVVHPGLEVDLGRGRSVALVLAGRRVLLQVREEPPGEEARGEPRELGDGEHARREAAQVDGEGAHGGLGERLAEADPDAALGVLALLRARVRVVAGADVGAHEAAELHLGAPAAGRVVSDQHRGAAAAEQAVGQHHGLVGAGVPVGRDGLGRHHERQRAGARPQRVPGQVQRDQPRAAPHPREVVRRHVLAQAVAARDPGRQGRRRGEHGDVEDEHVNVAGRDVGPGEELGDGLVEEGVHLVHRVPQRGRVLAALQDVARGVGLLADAGADDDAEEEAVVCQPQPRVALDHGAGRLRGQLAVFAGLVAHVVQEVAPRLPAARGGHPGQVGHGVRKEEPREQRKQLHIDQWILLGRSGTVSRGAECVIYYLHAYVMLEPGVCVYIGAEMSWAWLGPAACRLSIQFLFPQRQFRSTRK